jgi:hypothetical protein
MGKLWEVCQLLYVVTSLVVTVPMMATVLRIPAKVVSEHKRKRLLFTNPANEQMPVTPVMSGLEQSFTKYHGMCMHIHRREKRELESKFVVKYISEAL